MTGDEGLVDDRDIGGPTRCECTEAVGGEFLKDSVPVEEEPLSGATDAISSPNSDVVERVETEEMDLFHRILGMIANSGSAETVSSPVDLLTLLGTLTAPLL